MKMWVEIKKNGVLISLILDIYPLLARYSQ